MKRVQSFSEYRKSKKKRKSKKPEDGTIQTVHRIAQDTYRDWSTDAYRSQSARREVDVIPL
jgi:hypothetical protein